MKIAKDMKRTSFDLTSENSYALKKFSQEIGESYSAIINRMIRIFLNTSPDISDFLGQCCTEKVASINDNLNGMSEFQKQQAISEIVCYQELSTFFTQCLPHEKKVLKDKGMRKIYLKDGYLLIPDDPDWIILDNYATPSDCMYAGVVETCEPLDGNKKYNPKHYVFFSNYRYASNYPDGMDDAIYAACIQKDPSFKRILNATVTPEYDGKEIYTNMTNLDAYRAAPCPGIYHIVEQGDPMYFAIHYEPPYGAMIIRD